MLTALALAAQMTTAQTGNTTVDRACFVMRRVQAGFTLAEFKQLLHPTTKFEGPTWTPPVDGSLTGNVVRFSGPLNGSVSFLRAEQIEKLRDYSESVSKEFNPSDPIHSLVLVINSSSTYSRNNGYRLIGQLTKGLGKPANKPFFEREWTNDFGGWSAAWRVNGRKVGFYEFQGERYESRLETVIGAAIFQDGDISTPPPVKPSL